MFTPLLLIAQKKDVTGIVKESGGQVIPGVSVTIKGTVRGVQTNNDGKYSIQAENGETLVFSFIGMKKSEVIIGSQSNYDVVLEDEASSLDEIVVVGYGEQKKSDVTGAIVSVNSAQINERPVANAIQGIQGRAAGVDIGSNERPGQVGSITIRGVRSLTASNSPLYVVDGIPLISGGIENLNPNDIESIDVLKDASATAIFGSRGANGVVIVSTKRGKSGKYTLSLNSAVTTETLQNRSELMSAAEYIEYRRWAKYYSNPAIFPKGDQPTQANDFTIFLGTSDPTAWSNVLKGWSGGTWDGSKLTTTDWVDIITQKAVTQQHTISASGGTDKMKAYGSFGFLDNQGTVIGQGYKRYVGKLSVDVNATKWMTFGGSLNSTYGLNEYGQSATGSGGIVGGAQSGLYESSRSIFPYALPYDDKGNRVEFPGGDIAVKTVVDEAQYSQDQRINLRTFGSFYSELNIGNIFKGLDGLKYRLNFGPDLSFDRQGVYVDSKSVIRGGSSYGALNKEQDFSYTLDHLLMYSKTIKKHFISLTGLATQTEYKFESSFMGATNIPFASQKWNALSTSNLPLTTWSSNLIERQLRSYMGRVNYDFDGRFLITLSGRYDGASQLSEGNKWAFFPSTALGWRVDREQFMTGINWINQLKLRAGVGVTGNSAIDPYATKGGLSTVFYPIGSSLVSGVYNNTIMANQGLGWEKTTQYNFGVDFMLFSKRISGSLDYYTSQTSDLLLLKTIPSVTGFTSTYANVGQTASQGIDLTLNTLNLKKGDFEWNTTFNGSWQDNHIVSLANGKQDDINNGWFIGQSQSVIYNYEADGLWMEEDKEEMAKFNANGYKFTLGNVKPVDQNGDYKIDASNDRVIIGSLIPKFLVGITNNFDYKGVSLSIFLYGRMKYWYNTGGEGLTGRPNQRKVDYYTDNNINSEYQKPIYTEATGDPYFNALGYRSGSFLKIRNISLSYNLPSKISNTLGLANSKIYVQALNPGMVFNKVDFIDLDLRSSAWNKGFTVGINVDFK